MAKIANSIVELIGQTPVVKLNHIVDENSADVYLKLEYMNPGSSVKDRIALAMVEAAEKSGQLKAGDTIIEPTSGNTGIGLAWVAAAKRARLRACPTPPVGYCPSAILLGREPRWLLRPEDREPARGKLDAVERLSGGDVEPVAVDGEVVGVGEAQREKHRHHRSTS